MSRRHLRSLQDPDALRSLVANLREGIYISDMRGNVLDANPAFFHLLGVRGLEDLQAYGANEMVVDPAKRLAQLDLVERDGFVRDFELQLLRPDGAILTVLDTMYAIREEESGETIYHGLLVDITQRKQLEEGLRQQSVRDPLTGCYNRRHLADLDAQLSESDESWGCLFIDIDHFKQYNDDYGHQMGDNMLIRMSRFLMRQVRAEEPVVRVGGDEFVIVLRGATEAQADMVVQRMRLAALRTAPVPFSLGMAIREPSESLTSTINRADQNLLAVRVIERTPTRFLPKQDEPDTP